MGWIRRDGFHDILNGDTYYFLASKISCTDQGEIIGFTWDTKYRRLFGLHKKTSVFFVGNAYTPDTSDTPKYQQHKIIS